MQRTALVGLSCAWSGTQLLPYDGELLVDTAGSELDADALLLVEVR